MGIQLPKERQHKSGLKITIKRTKGRYHGKKTKVLKKLFFNPVLKYLHLWRRVCHCHALMKNKFVDQASLD